MKNIESINEEEFIIRIKDQYYIFSVEKNQKPYTELRDIQSINEVKFIIRIKDNDYIFSIKNNSKTYRVFGDIQSLTEEDFNSLNNQNKIKKISDIAYKTGTHIKISNNKIYAILMDNIYNNLSNIYNRVKEGKFEIINIDNINENIQ